MTLKSVVLPAPFGPMTPTTSPAATSSETSSSAVRPPKRTVTPSTRRSAISMCDSRSGPCRIGGLHRLQHANHRIGPAARLNRGCATNLGDRRCAAATTSRLRDEDPRRNAGGEMSTVPAAPRSAAVEAERRRICTTMLDRVECIAEDSVRLIREEIPAYRALQEEERFIADVSDQVHKHHRMNMIPLLEDRPVTLEEISFVRGAAMRRARAGLALEDYIGAYRIGQQNLWDTIIAVAGETPAGRAAALTWRRRSCAMSTSPRRTPATRTPSSSSTRSPTPTASGATCSSTCWPASCRRAGRCWPPRSATALRRDARLLVAAACRRARPRRRRAVRGQRRARALRAARARARWSWCASRRSWRWRRCAPTATRAPQCRRLEALQRRLGEEGMPLAIGRQHRRHRRRRAAARLRRGAQRARVHRRRRRRGRRAAAPLPLRLPGAARGRHRAPARRPRACASSSTRTARAAAC